MVDIISAFIYILIYSVPAKVIYTDCRALPDQKSGEGGVYPTVNPYFCMMNLSGLSRKILIVCGVVAVISSCKNVESDIGGNFFQSHSNMVIVDTMTVKLETVYLDSVPTNGTGIILAGSYRDSLTGEKTTTSYLQLGAPSVQSIPSTYKYDSIRFILKPNQYVLGDSTRPFTLAVHALDNLISIPEGKTSLYNTTSFSYETTPLGTWTGVIYPTRTDTIAIPLSDQLGLTLFDAIVTNPASLSTENLFTHNYLKGLAITSSTQGAIYGFDTGDSSALMKIYYHNPNDAKTPLSTVFQINSSNLQFNQVTNDLSGTPLAGLDSHTAGKVLNANQTGRMSVLQPLSNLAIKMSFPYLQNLGFYGRYVDILSAQLVLTPDPSSYSKSYPLPPALSLCETMNFYTVLDSLQGGSGVQHGSLVADYAYHNSYYTYDLTQYLVNEYKVSGDNNKTQLLLIPPIPSYNTAFPRLILGSQQAQGQKRGIKVRVEIVTYSPN